MKIASFILRTTAIALAAAAVACSHLYIYVVSWSNKSLFQCIYGG